MSVNFCVSFGRVKLLLLTVMPLAILIAMCAFSSKMCHRNDEIGNNAENNAANGSTKSRESGDEQTTSTARSTDPRAVSIKVDPAVSSSGTFASERRNGNHEHGSTAQYRRRVVPAETTDVYRRYAGVFGGSSGVRGQRVIRLPGSYYRSSGATRHSRY